MTAAVLYGKEDVKIEKVPIPRVEQGEVLVKVQVALTCGTDLKVYQRGYHARMIVPPALFGHESANVIAVVKRESQIEAARKMGAHDVVHLGGVKDPVEAVRVLSPAGRGADVVIEAVGRPDAWIWATEMVRKGGTVNFFGGCAKGVKVELDTNRLHYSEVTLKATFHHTPDAVRKAFALIAEKKIRPTDYITGEAQLSRLQEVLQHMMNRNGDIKTAIIPGQ